MSPFSLLLWLFVSVLYTYFFVQTGTMLLPLKKHPVWHLIYYVMSFFVCNMVIFYGDWDNLPLTMLLFLGAVFLCCQKKSIQKITIGFLLCSTAFSCNAILDQFHQKSIEETSWYLGLKLCFWLLLYQYMLHFSPKKDCELSSSLWKLLLLLTIMPLGVLLTQVLCIPENTEYPLSSTLLMILCILFFLVLIHTINILAKQTALEQSASLNELNRQYYQNLEQQQFQVRRLRHDMVNHLQTLAILSDSKRDEYLQELLHDSAIQNPLCYCENQTVNAVLTAKQMAIQQAQITFRCNLLLKAEIPIENIALCAVFSNSLDNAIEACEKLPVSQRQITLNAKTEKGLFILSVTNPLAHPVTIQDQKIATSKKENHLHGFGLKSIQEIVYRYQGVFELKSNNGIFSLFLCIPIEENCSY